MSEGRESRKRFRLAVAQAHGVGAGMSATELMNYVEEHGLPPRVDRLRALEERLSADEGATPPFSPPEGATRA